MAPSSGLRAIDEYFASYRYRVSQHQLDSYDDFVYNKIPAIVEEANRSFVMIKTDASPPAAFSVRVHGVNYTRPTLDVAGVESRLTPSLCRALGLSYTLSVRATVTITVRDIAAGATHDIDFPDVSIGRLPLMLHSSMCYLRDRDRAYLEKHGEDPDDPGGYFITWGAEKVLVTQERGAPNVPVVSRGKDANGKPETVVSVRSAKPENTVVARTTQIVVKGGAVFVRIPGRFVADVDVAIVFRALGVESDGDIARHVAPGDDARDRAVAEALRASMARAASACVWTQAQAMDHLAPLTPYGSNLVSIRSDKERTRGKTQALYILRREMLMGAGEAFAEKAAYLGILVRRAVLAHVGLEPETDREAVGNKRMFTAGMLLTEVFSEAYASFKSDATNKMDRAWYYGPWRGTGDVRRVVNKANVGTIFRPDHVTSVMQASMRGNWGKHGNPEEGGIVQDLDRLSWLHFLSHIRRTDNPLDRGLKLAGPRYIHGTQWGALCPVESPDGKNVGLSNNLAILCEVTASRDPAPAAEAVRKHGGLPLGRTRDRATVYVNGVPMFTHADPVGLCARLRRDRAAGALHHHTSVRLDIPRREVLVATDGGRCSRPLATATPPPPDYAGWDALIKSGAIEYVDADEAENALIAWDRESMARHTHAELHATAGLSVFEVTMPLMQHNPAPRNVLAAQQSKQGAGVYTSAFRARIDTMGMVMNYPQLPLVTTRYEDITAQSRHPGGVNAIVAFMTCTGFNMEDGVIINRSAVERGVFGITYYKNVREEEDSSADGGSVRFGNATAEESLDAFGLPRENEAVVPGRAVVGMIKQSPGGVQTPQDVRADEKWEGYVTDKVFVHDKPDEKLKVANIRFRKLRAPKPGDKLAARHAQKGVIGAMIPEHMMPYTRDGIIPDLLVNPHAIPSRMTIGQFMECLGAKAAAVGMSDRVDGTPLEPLDAGALRKALEKAGFEGNCNEVMYSARGNQLAADVFIGPTYYQRLKQMVDDKVNYRGRTGARDNVTTQPVGGRARGGGLRMGEMENNCTLAHGVMGMLAEATAGRSDGRAFSWQDWSGRPAVFNEAEGLLEAAGGGGEDKRFARRAIPRAFAAFHHEMAAMGVDMRLLAEDVDVPPASDTVDRSCGR